MTSGSFHAVERAALSLFEQQPPSVRWKVKGRAKTCPFGAVADALSGGGSFLDIGSGHGLFSFMLAFANPAATVTGIDTDRNKIRVAAEISVRHPTLNERVRFIATTGIPEESYDRIAIVDVLYLLPGKLQEELVRAAASKLRKGGVLAIKEISHRPRSKYLLAKFQELLAVKVLGMTRGQTVNFARPSDISKWLREEGLEVEESNLGEGYLHPHHLITARRAAPR